MDIMAYNSGNNDVSFCVDAYFGAYDISGKIISHNGGDMYFSGANEYDTSSTYETTIISDNEHDIIVNINGSFGLQHKIITNRQCVLFSMLFVFCSNNI